MDERAQMALESVAKRVHERRGELVLLMIEGIDGEQSLPRSLEEKWPYNVQDIPKTPGEVALFLARLHDAFYRIGGNGVFALAVEKLETEGATDGVAYARLLAERDCHAYLPSESEWLIPEGVAAVDVDAMLERLMGLVFGDGAEPVAAVAEVVSSNDERDAWLYEKDCEGVAASEIEQAFKPLAKQKNWALISGWRSIRAATTRYAKRKGLSHPPARQRI